MNEAKATPFRLRVQNRASSGRFTIALSLGEEGLHDPVAAPSSPRGASAKVS
jgi:hypothetical protein